MHITPFAGLRFSINAQNKGLNRYKILQLFGCRCSAICGINKTNNIFWEYIVVNLGDAFFGLV
ncbi:MAG: hypothetical protein LBU34_17060 [Planctomycetaceae bacterium]|nr:hypothetical protein [Planctomycetaceae bacterium]